jgi:hypothetical protein
MRSSHWKLSQAPPDMDMFLMVEKGDLKTIDVDILIACNIIRYMGWWWMFFWQCFLATCNENNVHVWGYSQGNSPCHQHNHMVS